MKKRSWGFLVGGLLVALLLAGVVSNFASSHPDGLDSSLREGCTFDAEDNITGGNCPAQQEKEHEIGGPLADYGIAGIDNEFLSTGLSGVLGVLLTFAVAGGAFWLVRRRGAQAAERGAADGQAAERGAADGQAVEATPEQTSAGRAG
ncbi:PDGLE domain-containing protein [Micromonospora sp. H33]|uniref:PDGLE domain-containing protein n=1 Tax=Micromonospora sp. H33 TaxID=3452215 RepID=UPI003F8CB9BA